MSGVLKLVAHVGAEIQDVPAHTQRAQRTEHAAWIELPAMTRVFQVAMRGDMIARDQKLFPFCLSRLLPAL